MDNFEITPSACALTLRFVDVIWPPFSSSHETNFTVDSSDLLATSNAHFEYLPYLIFPQPRHCSSNRLSPCFPNTTALGFLSNTLSTSFPAFHDSILLCPTILYGVFQGWSLDPLSLYFPVDLVNGYGFHLPINRHTHTFTFLNEILFLFIRRFYSQNLSMPILCKAWCKTLEMHQETKTDGPVLRELMPHRRHTTR